MKIGWTWGGMTGPQKRTVALVLGGLAGLLGGIEAWTLLNDIPGDTITDSFRALASADLGVLILLAVAMIVGVVVGHIWSRWGGRDRGVKDSVEEDGADQRADPVERE